MNKKIMKIAMLLLLNTLLFSFSSLAQVKLIKRIERDENDPGYRYTFLKHGVDEGIIKYISENKEQKTYTFHFEKYDNFLNKQETVAFDVPNDLDYNDYTSDANNLYFLNYNFEFGNYELRTIDKNLLEITDKRTGTFPKNSKLKNLSAFDSKIIFVFGINKNKQKQVQIMDLNSGQTKIVNPPVEGFKKCNYKGFHEINDNNEYEFQMRYEVKIPKQDLKYYIFRYTLNGELINGQPIILSLKEDKEFSSIRFLKSKDGDGFLISGTYSSNDEKTEGLLTGKIRENGEVEYLKLINLFDLDHFTDYLSERQQERIEKKKERKEEYGKTLEYKGLAVVHGFYCTKFKNYLVTEFYYPTYRTESYTAIVDGRTQTNVRTVFDGYQYTHAMIASVLDDGSLEWTNIFEMNLTEKPRSAISYIRKNINTDNDLELSYANGNKLKFLTFTQDGKISKEKDVVLIETGKSDEEVIYTSGASIMHWYDNNYIVIGYQKVKDIDPLFDEKKKREVFFINMIQY